MIDFAGCFSMDFLFAVVLLGCLYAVGFAAGLIDYILVCVLDFVLLWLCCFWVPCVGVC